MDISLFGTIGPQIGNQNYVAVFDFAEAILEKISNQHRFNWQTALLKADQESLVLIILEAKGEQTDRQNHPIFLAHWRAREPSFFPMGEERLYVGYKRMPLLKRIHLY